MNTIKIENLNFDAALDSHAMDAVTGGWGIGGYFKKKIGGVVRGVNRVYRTARRGARKIIRNRARNGGAKFVFGAISVGSPSFIMNSWLAS